MRLAKVYRLMRRYDQAGQALFKGFALLDRKPDQAGVVLLHLLSNLGAVYFAVCLRKTEQKDLAVQQESRAKQILSTLPPEHTVGVSQLTRR